MSKQDIREQTGAKSGKTGEGQGHRQTQCQRLYPSTHHSRGKTESYTGNVDIKGKIQKSEVERAKQVIHYGIMHRTVIRRLGSSDTQRLTYCFATKINEHSPYKE